MGWFSDYFPDDGGGSRSEWAVHGGEPGDLHGAPAPVSAASASSPAAAGTGAAHHTLAAIRDPDGRQGSDAGDGLRPGAVLPDQRRRRGGEASRALGAGAGVGPAAIGFGFRLVPGRAERGPVEDAGRQDPQIDHRGRANQRADGRTGPRTGGSGAGRSPERGFETA